jgi:hypothetical protein
MALQMSGGDVLVALDARSAMLGAMRRRTSLAQSKVRTQSEARHDVIEGGGK